MKTVNDKFLIPGMDKLLDKQDDANILQQLIYEYSRMSFVPATFQRCMNNLLQNLIYKDCLVYLDDIIIYSTSLVEHILSLRKVYTKPKDANLKFQLDKYELMKKGNIVTNVRLNFMFILFFY